MKKVLIGIFYIFIFYSNGQQINMDFPKFAGKAYNFIIFQGEHQEVVSQNIIPENGKFTLIIPEIYGSYTGMSRWLITGTKEGGGLDMFIPGHNFSVSCKENLPNEKNIIYTDNEGNYLLNGLYKKQEKILLRYQSMMFAIKAYDSSFSSYSLFKLEHEMQKNNYLVLQKEIREKTDYISNLFSIINITRGLGKVLSDKEDERSKDISEYIYKHLDWNVLYTSGHWSSIIEYWVSIHANVLTDLSQFLVEYRTIRNKIRNEKYYKDFCDKVVYCLRLFGKANYIENLY